jgi:integrase
MSLIKRGKTWWIDFTTLSGQRIRRSAGTANKIQAKELHDRLKAESWSNYSLGTKPEYTWDQAAVKYLSETQYKATHEDDMAKLRWLQQFLRSKLLIDIDREFVGGIAQVKVQEASPSTANRYLSLIRSVLRKACYEWEWIDRVPKIKFFKEPKRRVRWLTPDQIASLLKELSSHQRDLVLFALCTGLRQRNVITLDWTQVDMKRKVAWIHPDQAKSRKAINVPLNTVAMAVLCRQIGKHPDRVFTYHGKPITYVNTRSWRNALIRAGIENFRWHDLRHTWASLLAQQGTPLNVLQELGGWESEQMVRRYAHLSTSQLMQHSESISNVLDGTISAQSKLMESGG